jgi:hypothetical protein
MAPLTGDAGFLGVEQLSWAKYAISVQNKVLGIITQRDPETEDPDHHELY